MALSKVTISLNNGSIPGNATGTDYIRGLQFYGTAPGSFATTACQAVFSLSDAESKGITNTYSDETAAKGIVTISGTLAAGDTLAVTVTEPMPNGGTTVVSLGTGTAPATPTATTYAAAVVAAINALTYVHGYTATNSSGAITITARQGLGVALNSGTPIAITSTGSGTYAITQQFGTGSGGATTGVFSQKSVWHYHVSEFFRMNPNGKLWINFTSSPSADFAEVTTLINTANGECLSVGVYSFTARTASQVASDTTALQAIAQTAFDNYNYCSIIYSPNIKAISDISTLVNLQAYTNKFVSVCIMQDGNAAGALLFVAAGVSIGAIGTILGTSSSAAVNQDIGEVQAFNVSNGTEFDSPAFNNGTLVSSVAKSLLTTLDTYRYIFGLKYTRKAGTYFSDDWTATIATDDYNCQNRVLPILKAAQSVYVGVLPKLKSRLYLNTDGTLTSDSIEVFNSTIEPYLEQMKTAGEISDYVVNIDPTQDVLTTSTIKIVVKILPTGIARFIDVQLSYTAQIA